MGKLGAFSAVGDAVSSAGRSASTESLRARFEHVTTWVFDLDNTLYPSDSGIWPLIDERITLFLMDLFGLDGQSARALHQHYYLRHGTTLRGLIEENVDEAERFLEFVHDIDRSALRPNPILAREVARLPGRKLIFTNGSRNHAILTARQLGLDGLFEDAFDIVAAGLTPKPAEAAYETFFARYQLDPRSRGDVRGRREEPRGSAGARHDDGAGDAEGRAGRPPPAARPGERRGRGGSGRRRDRRPCAVFSPRSTISWRSGPALE